MELFFKINAGILWCIILVSLVTLIACFWVENRTYDSCYIEDQITRVLITWFVGCILVFWCWIPYDILTRPEPPKKITSKVFVDRFILVHVDPPKHMYVTLKHERTGQIFEALYVSKHCGTLPTLNASYNIRVEEYAMSDAPNDKKWSFPNLYSEMCN